MIIQQNISLKEYTTFRVGGPARYFVVVKNIEDLKQAVDFAKQNQMPVFVVGGGSNLIVSDEGVDGLVVKMEIKGIQLISAQENRSDPNIVQVIAGAGEIWDDFVAQMVEKGLYGIENLSYIPGTVGASVVQNIGAYGVEVKEVVDWIEVFNIKTGEIKKITKEYCQFGYRDSVFKKTAGKNFIVARVAYNLKKNGKLNLNYKDFSNRDPVSVGEMRDIVIDIRKNKLPDWKKVGTVGSFFKNPVITKEKLDELLKQYPDLPNFPQEKEMFKIPLAFVLDKILGMKGYREEEVGLYEKQPLALVNYDKATTKEIKQLALKIQKQVKEKTNLDIDFEVVEW